MEPGDLSFTEHVDQALSVANAEQHPLMVSRQTRTAHFDQPGTAPAEIAPADRANVISSTTGRRCRQAPVIDLDVPHTYVPSDTPGHAHLYLDSEMHDGKVLALMAVLRWTGVIERGHWRGFRRRGYSAVRLPWVRKRS